MYESDIKGKFTLYAEGYLYGIPLWKYSSRQAVFLHNEVSDDHGKSLPEEVTQGTLEGDLVPGDITFYRLQSTSDNKLRAYIAHGEILPVATRSFGQLVFLQFRRWDDSTATY